MKILERGRWRAGVYLGALLLIGASSPAGEPHKRVLLLYDEDRTLPGLAILDRSLRSTFTAQLGTDIEFFTESMNVSQSSGEDDEIVLRDYYAKKYAKRRLDLVVAVMGPALRFVSRHGAEAFPGVPVVFCGADRADLRSMTLPPEVTGVLVRRVFGPTIDVLLRLQPETLRVVVVSGTSAFDRHLLTQARSEFQPFERRLSFEYLTELPLDDLLSAVSRLPPKTAIVFVTLFRDGSGRSHVPHEAVAQIAAAANAPVYIFVDQYLGRGPVGGHLYSLELHGQRTAEIGARVLRGESPSTIPIRELPSAANMFDERQLRRWHLDERRLPADSVVEFREPSLWERYRAYVVGGSMLLAAQTALIAGLILQHVRRRRAEAELRKSYERVRDLGGRLLSAQEDERAHLARELHDDVSQKMMLLQLDFHALMHRDGSASTPDHELLSGAAARAADVGTRLRELSHRLHPAHLRLAGLTAALGTLQREFSTGDVSIDLSHEGSLAAVPPDVQLSLYRVVQEALSNAIKHGRADNIAVRLKGDPGRLFMTIDDNGRGFDTSTAAPGLGLISMRERVERNGGTLHLRSAPGAGTHLEVTVPYATDEGAGRERH